MTVIISNSVRAVALVLVVSSGACKKDLDARQAGNRGERHSTTGIPALEWTIRFMGDGLDNPTSFAYEELARMEMIRLENILQERTHLRDEVSSWEGPSLDSLLARTQARPGPMSMTLVAADGYRITCTRDDLRSAIVALKDGSGRWLAEVGDRSPVRLVPPGMPGNYWVRNVRQIIVETIPKSPESQ
jgi:hypothetical protein